MSSAVTEDSEGSSGCNEAGPEVVNSHDVSESSPGSEPTGFSHSGEERDAASSVRESETTAPADASERSAGSEFVTTKQDTYIVDKQCTCVCDSLHMTTRGHVDTTRLLF